MESDSKGFRDFLSDLDCLAYKARTGSGSHEEITEILETLARQAAASLDPRVHKLLMPSIREAIGKAREREGVLTR